eukprot:CAMPEP_0196735826 /NCGR_PEP_ID=MMETSP1091-20130531/14110_1 /TAXON_ID=302021 /ORGANISM="Rhodomonas sp., Strain CCMP768" /LENGTH=38 /DNA_ID= /DNA_START= /DNA_END= /DNA_ORIENTATION=
MSTSPGPCRELGGCGGSDGGSPGRADPDEAGGTAAVGT